MDGRAAIPFIVVAIEWERRRLIKTTAPAGTIPFLQDASQELSPRVRGVEQHYRKASRFSTRGRTLNADKRDLPVVKIVLQWVGTGRKVLDMGCQWGDITALIRDQGNDVIGVDLPACSTVARQNHGLLIVDHDLNEVFPMGDSDFDVIVASSVLDDISDDVTFLKRCFRILRPGGSIIVIVPNEVSWYRRVQSVLGCESRDYDNPSGYHTLHRYTLKGIKKLLNVSGFRIVRQAKCPKRYSRFPLRYWIERLLPVTFVTDLAIEAVKPD